MVSAAFYIQLILKAVILDGYEAGTKGTACRFLQVLRFDDAYIMEEISYYAKNGHNSSKNGHWVYKNLEIG